MPTNTPPIDMSELLRALAQRGEVHRYRKNTMLIHEGDAGDTLFILLSGRVRVFASGERGREITYGTYGAGDYLGEMSLDGGRRSASVVTLETTSCAVVTRRTLEAFVAEHPAFAFELMARLIRRARAATLSAKQLALNDVYGRLVALLNSLANPDAQGTRTLRERITHKEIAQQLGCSREMVSRLMKDLETGGYVATTEPHLRLMRELPARW